MAGRKTNLNQLRILTVLLKEPNLSRASEILGVSQPTLSSALKQLREEFDDMLLVRVGNRMELTTKARTLCEPLDEIFDAVDKLWQMESATPETASRGIVIGTTDYGAAMTASGLRNELNRSAPGISVQYVDVAETKELINRENELDFYLVPDSICHSPVFQDFKYFPLFEEEMVYLVGNSNPLAELSAEEIEEQPDISFATFSVGLERYSSVTRKVISEFEQGRKIDLRVQQWSLLPLIAEETDSVVLLPRRLAKKLQDKFACKIIGSMNPGVAFAYCIMWDRVYQSDNVHEFVRNIFKKMYPR
ncbi:LysR family transcriptional regulator [Halioglobus maricola]|uniref:LysR family transcriptional regulator n=1 Tax=Halioglobus maricola TaxID=2601894 RepID=A0A5P9NP28_9GAMM|nr:LysR family transcriptional regulator [Halioglobus maricola]QFU77195.1 LysR family transcriptional regulator [Halioglobus maricola]